jgi:epoxide hydrolase
MNADLRHHASDVEPMQLTVPEAAWARLRSRLGHGIATGEAWEASFAYGTPFGLLSQLVEYWRHDFALPRRIRELPCFETRVAEQQLAFVHARATAPAAVPILLLHGYTGSLAELGTLAGALCEAGCDVVCPALPGFGFSSGAPCATSIAEACGALMSRLGYARYAVHGSDLGAGLALRLAAVDGEHVAALHVSQLPAYPSQDPSDLASLTTAEKSRLARLTELHEQLQFQLPETPIQELAFALSRLELPPDTGFRTELYDDLLTSASLSCALGDAASRAALYRASALSPAPPSDVPVAVHELPLGAPSLRRFAERSHRVVEWREHERGGPSPAVEQPERLLQALATFCERLRRAAPPYDYGV